MRPKVLTKSLRNFYLLFHKNHRLKSANIKSKTYIIKIYANIENLIYLELDKKNHIHIVLFVFIYIELHIFASYQALPLAMGYSVLSTKHG